MNKQKIKTKEEARQKAIEWQYWQESQELSYEEVITWADYFRKLAKKFNLIREFKENGII